MALLYLCVLQDSDGHYKDVITTYRTHLLSAVQGHMDPDVKQALYNIIELRSMEQFCWNQVFCVVGNATTRL